MKKILIAIIVLALMMSCTSVAAFADDEPQLIVTTESADPGDTVTLIVSMENNPGIFNMTIPIVYDESVLENPEISGVGEGWTIGSSAYWENGNLEDSNYNGDTLKLTFHVKDGAKAGMTTVSLGPVDAWNTSETQVSFATTSGGINVNAVEVPVQPVYDAVPQTGFSVNPVIWVILVVGCTGFAGFLIFNAQEHAKK